MTATKRRWIIRSLFMVPIVLCVAAWAWSYVQVTNLVHNDVPTGHSERVRLWCGQLSLDYLVAPPKSKYAYTYAGDGWSWDVWEYSAAFPRDFRVFGRRKRDWLGFEFHHDIHSETSSHTVGFPFWFLTVFSAALLWFIWRKTRPIPMGRMFPVEVKSAKLEAKK